MSTSVNDIWDDDAVDEVPKRHKTPLADSDAEDSPRPTKRPRQTLFLPGSDDEDLGNEASNTRLRPARTDKDLDIDAIFGDIDDLDDNIASRPIKTVNADELERQIQAERRAAQPLLTPHQFLSSSPVKEPAKGREKGKDDDGEKKERRKPVHLNENLLAGENGFPQLIKSIKDFRPKGKGHEISDLNRLLGVYQFWTHSLYPKTQFRDTVTRIEKLCHSKRMQVKLSVWRDEFKGVAHEPNSDSEDGNENEDHDMDAEPSHQQSVAPSTASHRSSSPPPPPTSRPPSAASGHDDVFDDDFEALLQEAGSSVQTTTISSSGSKLAAATTVEEEDAFWADMDMAGEMDAPKKSPPISNSNDAMDEDEDMWDIIDQVNKEAAASSAKQAPPTLGNNPPPSPPRPPQEPQYADPSEWDDMYV